MKKINVGVALQGDPQKGITLIALIITVIVMLILVGVTINVALNGGLFEKANSASKQTQKEVDKEMLLSAVVATVDNSGNINLEEIQLPEGFTYNSTTKVYKSKTGNEFTINETTGKVEEVTSSNSSNSENTGNPSDSGDSENSQNAGNTEETHSFTLGDLGTNISYTLDSNGFLILDEEEFWDFVGIEIENKNDYVDSSNRVAYQISDTETFATVSDLLNETAEEGKYGILIQYMGVDNFVLGFTDYMLDGICDPGDDKEETISNFITAHSSVELTIIPAE